MEAAQNAINTDDVFSLKELPKINGILQFGLTLFVDKEFPNYNDMTLTQYSIAKRKPKTLQFLLDHSKELGIETKDILIPKTSNTGGSLLELALKFGSIGFYDTVDNECLGVLLNFFKSYISSEISVTEAPLTQAIKYKNNEAIKSLLKSGADLLYPLKKNQNEIDYYHLLDMPIITLFKLNNDKDKLKELFDNLLTEKQRNIIYRRTQNLKVDGHYFLKTLNELNLIGTLEFLSKHWQGLGPIITFDNENENEEEEEEKPEPELEQKCQRCGSEQEVTKTNNDGYLCQRCRDNLGIYE